MLDTIRIQVQKTSIKMKNKAFTRLLHSLAERLRVAEARITKLESPACEIPEPRVCVKPEPSPASYVLSSDPPRPKMLGRTSVWKLINKPSDFLGGLKKVCVWFDGGSYGDNLGYGSFRIDAMEIVRKRFGDRMTSNQAELATLHAAVSAVAELNPDTKSIHLIMMGDSQLALHTSTGKWRAKHPNIVPFVERARELLARFGHVETNWIPREEVVAIFGH